MRFDNVQDWLDWQMSLHPKAIELGLERINRVAEKLEINLSCPVITVAGTNGKGSTIAIMQAILQAAGHKVGCYTSPHIHQYHERIVMKGVMVTDAQLLSAFAAIDEARETVSLSFFEFGTLAALWLFMQHPLDIVILEVGLGGRLDAVNIIDADIAVITHLALDHTDWLGNSIEQIAVEKAGVARSGRPVVCTDPDSPKGLLKAVSERRAVCIQAAVDYQYDIYPAAWDWRMNEHRFEQLPYPALPGQHQLQNAAGAITAFMQLNKALRPASDSIRTGLQQVSLAGRFEIFSSQPDIILDVAHNPDSIQMLSEQLALNPIEGKTVMVFGVMRDKAVEEMIEPLSSLVDAWYLSAPQIERAFPVDELQVLFQLRFPEMRFNAAPDMMTAYQMAHGTLGSQDRLVVTGSFYSVAEVRALLL